MADPGGCPQCNRVHDVALACAVVNTLLSLRMPGSLRRLPEDLRRDGGVMVALLWFYFASLAILVSAHVDATIDLFRPSASL
jgi:hypothetical protein